VGRQNCWRKDGKKGETLEFLCEEKDFKDSLIFKKKSCLPGSSVAISFEVLENNHYFLKSKIFGL